MAESTFGELLDEGIYEAGDDGSVKARVKKRVQQWLRSQYASFDWGFTRRVVTSFQPSDPDDSGFLVGKGEGGVTEKVVRIADPIKIFLNDGKFNMTNVRIVTDWSDSAPSGDAVTSRGRPATARIIQSPTSVPGQWKVDFNCLLDAVYGVTMSIQLIPAVPSADADVVLYPEDETVQQAAMVFTLKYTKQMEEYFNEREILRQMVLQDRMKNAMTPGINDSVSLDPRVFK